MNVDRAEHLAWCRTRALEYLDNGDLPNAVTSMVSDLGKHDDTRLGERRQVLVAIEGHTLAMENDASGLRNWINGWT